MKGRQARQKGRAPKARPEAQVAGDLPSALDADESESEESIDASALVDQGDGVRVRRGARRVANDDERSYECPDEPPPGWGGDS